MTPLHWASAHSPERSTHLGSIALRCGRYLADGLDAGDAIPGLRVTDSTRTALWHASTEVYGFVDAPPGNRELLVRDPTRRYFPRRVIADFPDRSVPLGDPGATWMTLQMLPTVELPIPPAETVLWGSVTQPGGAPVPLAFVRTSTATRSYRALTDLNGVYMLWLVGEPADAAPNRTVHVHPLLTPPDPDSPWPSIPLDVDTLVPLSAAFSALYRFSSSDASALVRAGTRARMDITVS